MEVSETKKSNKYVLLATYCLAVVCLLAGLFVPLFNGNEILALQLPEILKNIVGQNPEFTISSNFINFGSETFFLNFTALVLVLYVAVTGLALLALIPIGICFRKDTKADRVIAYIIETAAVIVLSLHLVAAFAIMPAVYRDSIISSVFTPFEPLNIIGVNMLIALGGSLLALVIFSIANKKSTGVAKLVLFLLSAVALLSLFDLAVVIPELNNLGEAFPLSPALYGDVTGINVLSHLFSDNYGAYLETIGELKFKAAAVLSTVAALLVIVNYLFDVISLSTNAKTKGLLFNIVRYGLEFAAAVALVITAVVCGYKMGLFLIIIAAVGLVRLAMSVIRYVMARKRAKAAKEDEDNAPMFARPTKPPKRRNPDDINDIIVDESDVLQEDIPFVGAEPIEIDEEPVPAPEASEEAEQIAFIEPAPEPAPVEEPEEEVLTENPDEVQMEIEEAQTAEETFTEPSWGSSWDPEPVAYTEPEKVEEPAATVEEETSPAPVSEPEPVSEIKPEPAAETEQPATIWWEPSPQPEVKAEPVAEVKPEPVREEPKPEIKPEPVAEIKPEPVREKPKPEPKPEPVKTFNPVQRYAFGPDGELIYTIRYGGPSDEFIDKLSNDEKIEFAMTFIERNKGDIGNIPEYSIGGNNKKFFNAVFIYLGRIRGMISDSLLNKMFKELNML